ncbi:unnamed protein product [Lactuca virosa]|uniref:Calmodulin-binding domain-containing protein n=1 Tax=Lactuca virosa TaxID=75947 RepID=A0AAU9NSG1_9ASTR|nr:unnamed protein product [Lactuca virosa]
MKSPSHSLHYHPLILTPRCIPKFPTYKTLVFLRLTFIFNRRHTRDDNSPSISDESDSHDSSPRRHSSGRSKERSYSPVEGLSSAKAKAKIKKVKEAKSIFHRTWGVVLGIRPALRAVASMSREDWSKKNVQPI